MMARAAVRPLVPRAGLLMMVAANAPDVDVLWSWFGGTGQYLRLHRGWTHSLVFSPLIALLPLAIVWLVDRNRHSARGVLAWGWFCAWLGVLSHLAMDWTNIYGIRLLLPFSNEFFRLDSVNVVDFAIWALLLLGVALPALARLVSSEIGAKPGSGKGWAVVVLCLLACYEGERWLLHDRAVRTLDAHIYDGSTPVRVGAFAVDANPFAWKGVVETAAGFNVFYMNLREEFDPRAGRIYYKPETSAPIEAARKDPRFQSLIGFSNWLLWRITPAPEPEGASHVELLDLRFGTPTSPGLSAGGLVTADGRVLDSEVGFGRVQPR